MITTIREILDRHSLTQTGLSSKLGIPLRTIQNWCGGKASPPKWVIDLIEYRLSNENPSRQ